MSPKRQPARWGETVEVGGFYLCGDGNVANEPRGVYLELVSDKKNKTVRQGLQGVEAHGTPACALRGGCWLAGWLAARREGIDSNFFFLGRGILPRLLFQVFI